MTILSSSNQEKKGQLETMGPILTHLSKTTSKRHIHMNNVIYISCFFFSWIRYLIDSSKKLSDVLAEFSGTGPLSKFQPDGVSQNLFDRFI